MYKIFLDQNKIFQCNVKIEGAKLSESEARLLVETDNFTLTFKGSINSDGSVKIPISKLKGILEENYKGKISLEVIAEDTVFKPWESQYETNVSKRVEVVVEQESRMNESSNENTKPKMSFTMIPDEFDTKQHINEIQKILKKNSVSKQSLLSKDNQKVFNKLVETYCKLNHINNIDNIVSIKKDLLKNLK